MFQLELHQNHGIVYAFMAFETIFPTARQFAVEDGKEGEGSLIDPAIAGQRQSRYSNQIARGLEIRVASI